MLYLIKKTEITLLVNHKLESVFVHPDNTLAEITTQGMRLTTSKIVVTPHSDINVENSTSSKLSKPSTRFHHIYMLIEDITPPRFTFRSRVSKGISRLMNLTYFVGLKDANKQLIVVQTYEHSPKTAATCLEIMKEHGLIDPCAFLLKEESYIYEQSHYKANNMKIFEVLDTHNISEITQYIPKWKEVLPRF